MWVSSFKSWVSPYRDVKLLSLAALGVVLLVEHHSLILALSSPMMTIYSSVISKLFLKFLNSSLNCLGNVCTDMKLQRLFEIVISNLIH